MMSWLDQGVPPLFGAIFNKRSFVSVDNLVDLLYVCLEHQNAGNEIFLVSDGKDLSTTELLLIMAKALGKPARLVPVPVWLMRVAAILVSRRSLSSRLFDSLQVDISKTKIVLGWTPPVSIDESLNLTAQSFLKTHGL